MEPEDRPVIHCLVALPFGGEGHYTAPFVVALETAFELRAKGYVVMGPDPEDELALDEWLRARQWLRRLN